MGGGQIIYWMIEPGRKDKTNEVVGHATIIKGAGSIPNPAPVVVPVWAGDQVVDKKMMDGGKPLYYFRNE
ncbi:hypothetical protein LTR96_011241 [Exophiala xenobiotica]|nr:hypothetical protein LTR92_010934 [Exophiala xenobiotica]KAK5263348.1 hypothetical protein LTR96_011241 [Exophiala xenobiotica]KAK5332768.1 hypothetical protein LTR98_011105 [Exophiala xenobiotica]